jgi:kynurenine formamidase
MPDLTFPASQGELGAYLARPAGIPVVEHLTGLDQLPPLGATFTAVPLRVEGFGTIPV